MSTAIWWIRRDLRLTDNPALTEALKHAEQVVPVFIFDPALLNSSYVGPKRVAFLLEGLRHLDAGLRARGSRLIIRRGHPVDELATLMAETGAALIFAEEDYSPFARQRDEKTAESVPLHLVHGLTVQAPSAVLKDDNTPYTVYTPFSKSWKALPMPTADAILPAPKKIPTPNGMSSDPLPPESILPDTVPFPAGEDEAQRRLQAFVNQAQNIDTKPDRPIYNYASARDRMDLSGTSQLSPYLRFGMISARQAVVAVRNAIDNAPNKQAEKGGITWLNELIWREFYISILYHFPHVRSRNFHQKYDNIVWDNNEDAFVAWCDGQTGYPVVDAAMRQLVQSGWMHNRARMIVASFLVKDLLIDWRWGEKFFMQHLIDGDPAANNGGWQWAAGTGTDAAPYFRIFNPILQSKKFDPDGKFIRCWIPELRDVPDKFIHTPWEMPSNIQRLAGCIIGKKYPVPIVDHKQARERTLAAYGKIKEKSS